jgi:calcineurin-like phosphoesterase family protein
MIMPEIFLMSDTHFDHDNIIKYCSRPFKNRHEMNKHMCYNWNSIVGYSDLVYFLGDITYGRNSRNAKFWIDQLIGNKVLIKGNHDRHTGGLRFVDYKILESHGLKFFLVHNPDSGIPMDFIESGGWIIHGHHHNNEPELYPLINRENRTINVSAELIGYMPIRFSEVLKMVLNESYTPDFTQPTPYQKLLSRQTGIFNVEAGRNTD